MALDMTAEQRDLGKANYAAAAEGLARDPDRRGFMKSLAAGAGRRPPSPPPSTSATRARRASRSRRP